MLSVLRNRVGVSGIVAVVALVLAMTGGAWAASKYIITSTKQIKPSVLKALQGKTGPAGANGANGAPGAKGADGTNGTNGTNGLSVVNTPLEPGEGECTEGGAEFTVGTGEPSYACNGEPGEAGPEGSPWVAGHVPAGAELRGTWALNANAAASEFVYTTVTTGVPLGNPISLILPAPATLGTLECAGSANEPLPPTNEGEPIGGILCFYTAEFTNLKPEEAVQKVPASRGGSVIKIKTLIRPARIADRPGSKRRREHRCADYPTAEIGPTGR